MFDRSDNLLNSHFDTASLLYGSFAGAVQRGDVSSPAAQLFYRPLQAEE